MAEPLAVLTHPELVFGIAGPIGIDADALTKVLEKALQDVNYSTQLIRVTDEVRAWPSKEPAPAESDFYTETSFKMKHASSLCREFNDPAAIVRIALNAIKERRLGIIQTTVAPADRARTSDAEGSSYDEERAVPRTAFIIRQLKRPQEVELLRRVYGKQFILISAYASRFARKSALEKKIRRTLKISARDQEVSTKADDLIYRDESEGSDAFGQHLRETFHLADFFVDGVDIAKMEAGVGRFINALFGRNDIGPTRDEYGMYAAKAASLRSLDLSRQIGAAIFSKQGELVTQGCNEVPRAGGGTYWEGEIPDYRDVKIGHDPNDLLKKEMLRDLLERLAEGEFLSEEAKNIGNSQAMVEALIYPPREEDAGKPQSQLKLGVLRDAFIMEVTEYGRVVHAEMSAICDAARLGKAIKAGVLYTTTFPCHNCTKHIISSGIDRVIFIEPYPKSRAKELHENEIELESDEGNTVAFLPFLGISPVKYRDIFQKIRSRKVRGVAREWYFDEPRPMIDVSGPAYLEHEAFEFRQLRADFVLTRLSDEVNSSNDTAEGALGTGDEQ